MQPYSKDTSYSTARGVSLKTEWIQQEISDEVVCVTLFGREFGQ
jgi:hypothetical protein